MGILLLLNHFQYPNHTNNPCFGENQYFVIVCPRIILETCIQHLLQDTMLRASYILTHVILIQP